MEVAVSIVNAATEELVAGINRLLPQLISSGKQMTLSELEVVVSHQGVYLFVAYLGDKVVGTAQLSVYPRTYSPMGWVDGVVVDGEERGKGIAVTLMNAVLEKAKSLGLPELSLTSNPKREAANHLYTKLGFEKYDTNYYRYKFL